MNVMSLDRYRVFRSVARTGNLTRAGEQLFLTQSAVSQALQKLEADIGSQLVIRTSRGIRLTPEGQQLYEHVEAAFRLLEAGERRLEEMQHLERGDIRIGASDTLCRYYLLPTLDAFHRAHPMVRLHVTNGTSQDTLTLLRSGAVDFGVVNLPVAGDDLLIAEGPVLQDGFVVGEALRALAARAQPIAELARHPVLLLERGSVTRSHFDRYFAAHDVSVTPEIELGSLDLLADFARIGLGVAGVVIPFVQHALDRGELYQIVPVPPLPPRSIGLVARRDTPLSHAAQALMTALQKHPNAPH